MFRLGCGGAYSNEKPGVPTETPGCKTNPLTFEVIKGVVVICLWPATPADCFFTLFLYFIRLFIYFCTNMTPHIDRPPPSVRLKYLHQFRPRHSENFHIYYTLYYEHILGVFLSQIGLGEERKFEWSSHLYYFGQFGRNA